MSIEEAEVREEKVSSGRYARQIDRLKLLLRTLAIFLPIALFGAAILVGMVFWVTLIPIFGTLTVALTVAATILALLAAFIFVKS